MPVISVPISAAQQPAQLLARLIREIEHVLTALFPSWLAGAEGIRGQNVVAREALLALVRKTAKQGDLFGPYLEAITLAASGQAPGAPLDHFAPETAFRECHRLFCRAYETDSAVLILSMPDGLSDETVLQLQDAAIWMASQNAFRVWIAGQGVELMERISTARVERSMPFSPASIAGMTPETHVTPLSGLPNPISSTEQRMEQFLCRCVWAAGRAWNVSWSAGPLDNPIRVDLLWEAERLVVELDGRDHLDPEKYARDRMRDRSLQMAGFRVLRYTNEEVSADLSRVASEIERFLTSARD